MNYTPDYFADFYCTSTSPTWRVHEHTYIYMYCTYYVQLLHPDQAPFLQTYASACTHAHSTTPFSYHGVTLKWSRCILLHAPKLWRDPSYLHSRSCVHVFDQQTRFLEKNLKRCSLNQITFLLPNKITSQRCSLNPNRLPGIHG